MPKDIFKLSVMELLDGEIKLLREAGYSLEQIAEKGGVTRERIRQIINRFYPGVKSKLLSERQVAKTFGVSPSTISSLRRRGLIHPVKIGDTYRFDEKTVEEVKTALNRPCRICGTPIFPGNTKLCEKHSAMMRDQKLRLSLPGERETLKKAVKRWNETHMEEVRILRRNNSAKFRARISKRNYEISRYKVRLTYPGFKPGEQFKAIGFRDNKLLLADGRMIPIILVTKVLGPKSRLSMKKLETWDKT